MHASKERGHTDACIEREGRHVSYVISQNDENNDEMMTRMSANAGSMGKCIMTTPRP
jgi:hypothetical protein